MHLNKLLKTALCLFVLCGSTSAFAQVKIGTNPTTIEAASNLEIIGSTAGRKVKINKTTGQLTIADGTQGTAKILTSDASGGASWQVPAAQNTDVWIYARQSGTQAVALGATVIQFDAEVYDRGIILTLLPVKSLFLQPGFFS